MTASNDEGIALFVVLAFVLIVVAVVAPFSIAVHIEYLVTRNAIQETQDRFAIEGISRLSAEVYAAQQRDVRSEQDTGFQKVECHSPSGHQSVYLRFQNHAGLIDLNSASAGLLKSGFLAAGLDFTLADRFAEETVLYRTRAAQLESTRAAYKHAPFESIFELGDIVIGDERLTRNTLFERVPLSFTIHSRSAMLDISQAPTGLGELAQAHDSSVASHIVRFSGRMPALSIVVHVIRTGRPVVTARAVYSVESDHHGFRLRPAEPLRLDRRAQTEFEPYAKVKSKVAQCDALFSTELQGLLFELIR